jgi:CMP-N-acetylneuraminic acid synthetase
MEILGFIPARGGSQRVPDKNIKLLNGKPLIVYTIEAARQSKHVNRIVVSTDSEKIAETAREYGSEIPFFRPEDISKSESTEMQFLQHALAWFAENENYEPDLIVMLYPTSPFRKPQSIDLAVEKMIESPEADSLRSVKLCSEHPYKMWTIEEERLKAFVETEDSNVHTFSYHLLPTTYIQNASIYITRPRTIKNKRSYIGDTVIPLIMDESESIDINTPLDFQFAEMVMRELE